MDLPHSCCSHSAALPATSRTQGLLPHGARLTRDPIVTILSYRAVGTLRSQRVWLRARWTRLTVSKRSRGPRCRDARRTGVVVCIYTLPRRANGTKRSATGCLIRIHQERLHPIPRRDCLGHGSTVLAADVSLASRTIVAPGLSRVWCSACCAWLAYTSGGIVVSRARSAAREVRIGLCARCTCCTGCFCAVNYTRSGTGST